MQDGDGNDSGSGANLAPEVEARRSFKTEIAKFRMKKNTGKGKENGGRPRKQL